MREILFGIRHNIARHYKVAAFAVWPTAFGLLRLNTMRIASISFALTRELFPPYVHTLARWDSFIAHNRARRQ